MFEAFAETKQLSLSYLDRVIRFANEQRQTGIARKLGLLREELGNLRYRIALVGEFNRGKSTLVNTLLGRDNDLLSPVQFKQCTSTIISFLDRGLHPQGREEAVVHFEDNAASEAVPFEQLRDYVTEQGNPANRKEVRSVDIYADFPLLNGAATLVDTPGRGGVQRYHETLLNDFLPAADAIILLISADAAVNTSEWQFLQQLGDDTRRRMFYVLTKRDLVPRPGDMAQVRDRVREKVREAGLEYRAPYETNAKVVFEARCRHAPPEELDRLWRESGVAKLEADLETFILQHSSEVHVLIPRIEAVLREAGVYCRRTIDQVEADLSKLEADVNTLTAERDELLKEAQAARRNAGRSLEKFSTQWKKEALRFTRAFRGKAQVIGDRIADRLDRGHLGTRALVSFRLQKLVAKEINAECERLVLDLEEGLNKAVSTLSDDLRDDAELYLRAAGRGADALSSVISLGGVLASGYAVATAGVSAAGAGTAWAGWLGASQNMANSGLLVKIGAFFVGSQVVPAAMTAAVAATGAGIALVVLAGVTYHVSKQIITATQGGRVATLAENAIEEIITAAERALDQRCSEITDLYRETFDESLAANAERVEALAEAIRSDDPQLKQQLTGKRTALLELCDCEDKLREHLLRLPPPARA